VGHLRKLIIGFMSSKYTAFRCPEELLEKAKARAKRDRRSLSNYLITLIDKDVAGMVEAVSSDESGVARAKLHGDN
jgi:predicted DNA-binding protein